MVQSWAESIWEINNYGRFIKQFLPNIIRSIRQFERIKKYMLTINVYYVQSNIYIYIYIYKDREKKGEYYVRVRNGEKQKESQRAGREREREREREKERERERERERRGRDGARKRLKNEDIGTVNEYENVLTY